jgi:hypothetical protein
MDERKKQVPLNHGNLWESVDENQLRNGVRNGRNIVAIAATVGRSVKATRKKLQSSDMIISLIHSDISQERIMQITEISESQFKKYKEQSNAILAYSYITGMHSRLKRIIHAEMKKLYHEANEHFTNNPNITIDQLHDKISQLPVFAKLITPVLSFSEADNESESDESGDESRDIKLDE